LVRSRRVGARERHPNKPVLKAEGDKGVLLDPGGYFVFERVYENAKEFVKPENVVSILYFHQDPDVIG
jgi:flavorubredoxin